MKLESVSFLVRYLMCKISPNRKSVFLNLHLHFHLKFVFVFVFNKVVCLQSRTGMGAGGRVHFWWIRTRTCFFINESEPVSSLFILLVELAHLDPFDKVQFLWVKHIRFQSYVI